MSKNRESTLTIPYVKVGDCCFHNFALPPDAGDLRYIERIDRLGRNDEEIQVQWRILIKEQGVIQFVKGCFIARSHIFVC